VLVLITHECSGQVREEMRAAGHEAYSCDLQPADDGSPHHLQGDAIVAIRSRRWHVIGMHCECRFLTCSGIHWNDRGRGWEQTNEALEHVQECREAATAHSDAWYLENSLGILSTRWREPDQILQPYEFGDDASKQTYLWLHNLPPLKPGTRFSGRWVWRKNRYVERWSNQTDSGQNKLPPSETRSKERSRTYPGIARAMARQWVNASIFI
jgi:hypothetical protein